VWLPGRAVCHEGAVKIATWNINSIRAREERLLGWLAQAQPDVLCLQELKCTEAEFPFEPLKAAGYHAHVHGQKTYNGVALITKTPATDLQLGLSDGVEDPQSRVIAGTVKGVRVICVYAPNGQSVGSPAYQYKLAWFERLGRFLGQQLPKGQAGLVAGDFNVAPKDIDVHDPTLWEGQTLFSLPEREALKNAVSSRLVDAFRRLHAESKFTWWDYRQLSFPKNKGLRIDHLFLTPELAERCTACEIDREARKGKQPSDHAPVWVEVTA
jgi:exodeoxyribonuclease III